MPFGHPRFLFSFSVLAWPISVSSPPSSRGDEGWNARDVIAVASTCRANIMWSKTRIGFLTRQWQSTLSRDDPHSSCSSIRILWGEEKNTKEKNSLKKIPVISRGYIVHYNNIVNARASQGRLRCLEVRLGVSAGQETARTVSSSEPVTFRFASRAFDWYRKTRTADVSKIPTAWFD